jgi:hypothetical protein
MNKYLNFFCLFTLLFFNKSIGYAQSFSDEKTSAINFVKRVYASSPFEGVKKIEGDEANYHTVAVSYLNIPKDSILANVGKAQLKAQAIAEQGFAEPCVKFEMIEYIVNGKQLTYLFLCTTLDEFITGILKKKLVDGAKFISAPGNKFVIASISLENSKYSSAEMRDKAAFMKAKQFTNTLINGSTITSDQLIRTDESDSRTEVTNIETVREHAMGFIQGVELLFSKELTPNKTTYVYFTKL